MKVIISFPKYTMKKLIESVYKKYEFALEFEYCLMVKMLLGTLPAVVVLPRLSGIKDPPDKK